MGGTPVQLWSGPAALKQCGNTTAPGFWRPYSWLFWKMVMPLRGLQLKAVVWYQGEANAREVNQKIIKTLHGPHFSPPHHHPTFDESRSQI